MIALLPPTLLILTGLWCLYCMWGVSGLNEP